MSVNVNIGHTIFIGAGIVSLVALCLSGVLAYIRYVADIAPSKLNSVLLRHSFLLLLFNVLVYLVAFGFIRPVLLSSEIIGSVPHPSEGGLFEEGAIHFPVPPGYNENYSRALGGKISSLEVDNIVGQELYINIRDDVLNTLKVFSRETLSFDKVNGQFDKGKLRISMRDIPLFGRTTNPVYMNVTSESLRKIAIRGPVNVYINLPGRVDLYLEQSRNSMVRCVSRDARCTFSEMGDIKGIFVTDKLFIDVSGATKGVFRGDSDQFSLRSQGAANISALNLMSKVVEVKGEGAGKLSVYASEKLEADLSGMCRLIYYGKPSIIREKTSGMSRIQEGDPADLGVHKSSSGRNSFSRSRTSIKVDKDGVEIRAEEDRPDDK